MHDIKKGGFFFCSLVNVFIRWRCTGDRAHCMEVFRRFILRDSSPVSQIHSDLARCRCMISIPQGSSGDVED
jgi:hypothetical protein